MNFAAVIEALEFAIQHRGDIAHAAREAIHVVRRIETMSHHHNKSVDDVLTTADKGLSIVEKSAETARKI